ncbi:MAG: hypothetical protein ABIO70_15050 [Pseudomonadota bacterium]
MATTLLVVLFVSVVVTVGFLAIRRWMVGRERLNQRRSVTELAARLEPVDPWEWDHLHGGVLGPMRILPREAVAGTEPTRGSGQVLWLKPSPELKRWSGVPPRVADDLDALVGEMMEYSQLVDVQERSGAVVMELNDAYGKKKATVVFCRCLEDQEYGWMAWYRWLK